MARPSSRHPTELELEILKVLWDRGPLTGRDVRDALATVRDLAYTSVMTIMNIMVTKGYLKRTKSARGGYAYSARVGREPVVGRMLSDIVRRAFAGSASAAMLRLLASENIASDELESLMELAERKLAERKSASHRPEERP